MMKRGLFIVAALLVMVKPVFYELMSAGAIVDLISLGVEQDRTEFIELLDYWEDVAGDLFISKTIVSSNDEKVVVDVCYRLPIESFTNRETFHFDGEKIVRQIQEKLRTGC